MNIDLYNGDCLEVMDRLIAEGVVVDAIITDPPFNIGYHYGKYNDNMKENEYYKMLANIIKNKVAVIIHYPESLHRLSIELGYAPTKVVSWVYNSNTPKQHRDIAFYNINPNFNNISQDYKNPKDKRIAKRISEGKRARAYDWWNVNQVKNVSKDKTGHPCQMPLEIMENIIKMENLLIIKKMIF
jgi:site-specific DNA-methyltransferase (adenine-specific)